MPTIPLNVILIWPGTNAAIPDGWARTTELDGKFTKGALEGVEPNVTGGSDTHTHTSPTHSHTMVNHTHTGDTSRSSGDFETHGGNTSNGASRDAHYHSYTTDLLTGGTLTGAITYQAASSLPPYHEVIFIEPDTVAVGLPDGVIALFGGGDVPTNWDICDGDNATPDLTDKFLRGAAAAADAGATGGALSHAHTVNHTHDVVNHSHQSNPASVGTSSDGSRDRENFGGGGAVVEVTHKHTVYLGNTSDTPSTYTSTAGSAENNVQPLHKLLRAIQNNSGAFSKPRGIIALWLGELDSIPQGWFLCDGENGTPDMQGYHLKITATEGEVEDVAGANTHAHAASNSHTHTAAGSHTHTGYSSHSIGGEYGTTSNPDGASKPHSHSSLASCSSQTSTWNAATISADSSNNEPAYRTVAFIMFKYETFGGAAVLGGVLVN